MLKQLQSNALVFRSAIIGNKK